jgi:hypothetical protein
MDPILLHSVLTRAAASCSTLITALAANDPNRVLIQHLADCSTRCIAAAQSCQLGTCLPETLQRCREACDQAAALLERLDANTSLVTDSLETLRQCSAACSEL